MQAADCNRVINNLPTMSRRHLQQRWQELFGRSPGKKLRRELMVPILAYRVQEKAYGGLKPAVERQLLKLAQSFARNIGNTKVAEVRRIKPGTRLLREWQGEIHEVIVTERGFLFGGKEHSSLSRIARLITGTQWSGPLFFGLRSHSLGSPRS